MYFNMPEQLKKRLHEMTYLGIYKIMTSENKRSEEHKNVVNNIIRNMESLSDEELETECADVLRDWVYSNIIVPSFHGRVLQDKPVLHVTSTSGMTYGNTEGLHAIIGGEIFMSSNNQEGFVDAFWEVIHESMETKSACFQGQVKKITISDVSKVPYLTIADNTQTATPMDFFVLTETDDDGNCISPLDAVQLLESDWIKKSLDNQVKSFLFNYDDNDGPIDELNLLYPHKLSMPDLLSPEIILPLCPVNKASETTSVVYTEEMLNDLNERAKSGIVCGNFNQRSIVTDMESSNPSPDKAFFKLNSVKIINGFAYGTLMLTDTRETSKLMYEKVYREPWVFALSTVAIKDSEKVNIVGTDIVPRELWSFNEIFKEYDNGFGTPYFNNNTRRFIQHKHGF